MSDNKARAVPATNATASSGPAAGPLVVSETNPRYFTVAASDVAHRRAVYLTGSHVNNNFHDGSGPGADCAEVPEPNDFRGYLGFLKERGHNFIRLWRWEQFKSQVAGGAFHFCMTPQPWPRSGPGGPGQVGERVRCPQRGHSHTTTHGLRAADRRLVVTAYGGKVAKKFFQYCYALRSEFVHDGKPSDDIPGFNSLVAELDRLVADLLAASVAFCSMPHGVSSSA